MEGQSGNIFISDKRLYGKPIENIFFPDSKSQLEQFWGIHELEELQTIDTLSIPPSIADYIKLKNDETTQDGKERSATFGFSDGSISVTNEATGTDSIYDLLGKRITGEMSISTGDESTIKYSWNRLFGKPKPIFYHSHPHVPTGTIKKASLTFPNGNRIEVPGNNMTDIINFQSDTFSDSDLSSLFASNRYQNSFLLSTHNRILYIAPSKLFLPVGIAKFDRSHIMYRNEVEVINTVFMSNVFDLDIDEIYKAENIFGKIINRNLFRKAKKLSDANLNLDELTQMRDNSLVRTCNLSGYEVFSSSKQDINNLERLIAS